MADKTSKQFLPEVADHELLRVIGTGAYGDVWIAKSVTGTLRAVKIVYRSNFHDSRPYEREFAGIQRYEPISRSNEALVDVLQIGRNDPVGYFYYVMELADDASEGVSATSEPIERQVRSNSASKLDPENYAAKTLTSELRRRGRLSYEECLQLGLSLNLALIQLHRHGLIHRDIKPSNIIFINSIPKLADMGLVTDISEAKSFVGTEGYIPPEGPNTPRADLYSLGKVLYEASMGKDRNEFPEPFTLVEEDQNSQALMELNAVVLKACALDPRDGYQSAEEMYLDLALLQSGRSVKRRRVLEKRLAFASRIGMTMAGLAVLAFAGYFYQQHRAKVAADVARNETELRRVAEVQKTRAETSERQSLERLVRMHVATGVRYMEDGDLLNSLLWFVEAWKADRGNGEGDANHRIRVRTILNQLPKLTQMWRHDGETPNAQFSPDGRYVLLGTDQGRGFRLFSAAHGTAVSPAVILQNSIKFAIFSPDSRNIFTLSGDGLAQLWRMNKPSESNLGNHSVLQEEPLSLTPGENKAFSGAFSRDSRLVAIVRDNGVLEVVSVLDGKMVCTLKHPSTIQTVDFSPDGNHLISTCGDGVARIWNVTEPIEAKHAIQSITKMRIHVAKFSPDGKQVLIVANDQAEVRTFGGEQVGEPKAMGRGWWIVGADYSPDGKRIVTWARDATAKIWDSGTGVLITTLQKHQHVIIEAEFSGDGRWILTTSEDGSARVWNASSGEMAAVPLAYGRGGNGHGPQFSSDGSKVIVTAGGLSKLYDLTQSELSGPLLMAVLNRKFFFTSDSRNLVTIEHGGIYRIWDPKSGATVSDEGLDLVSMTPQPLDVALGPVNPSFYEFAKNSSVSVRSPDGSLEAVVLKNTVVVQDAQSKKIISGPLAHKENIISVSFALDGSKIATSSHDSTVRVWDCRTGDPLSPPLRHPSPASQLAFSPDNRMLATHCRQFNNVHIWNIEAEERSLEEIVELCRLLTQQDLDEESRPRAILDTTVMEQLWQTCRAKSPNEFQVQRVHEENWRLVRAFNFIRSSDIPAALTQLDPAVRREWLPRYAEFLSGGMYPEQVKASFQEAMKENPDDFRLRTIYAAKVFNFGEFENVEAALKKAIALQPNQSYLWSWKARSHSARKQWNQAKNDLEQANKLQPHVPANWSYLGGIYRETGDWDNALKSYNRANNLLAGVDSESEEAKGRFSNLFPVRDVNAGKHLIDLSRFYNSTLKPLEAGSPLLSVCFDSLPIGIVRLGGVEFDIRGAILLDSAEVSTRGANFNRNINGIPIRQKAKKVHFLHTADFSQTSRQLIGKYTFHLANGKREEQPIEYHKEVRDCRESARGGLENARVAFTSNNDINPQVLYLSTWQNLHPDSEIVMMDFGSVWNYAAPILVAVTVEP